MSPRVASFTVQVVVPEMYNNSNHRLDSRRDGLCHQEVCPPKQLSRVRRHTQRPCVCHIFLTEFATFDCMRMSWSLPAHDQLGQRHLSSSTHMHSGISRLTTSEDRESTRHITHRADTHGKTHTDNCHRQHVWPHGEMFRLRSVGPIPCLCFQCSASYHSVRRTTLCVVHPHCARSSAFVPASVADRKVHDNPNLF